VAIDDHDTGARLCYGVIADVSETGACVWTSGAVAAGSRLVFRVSVCSPDRQAVAGRVVWASQDAGSALRRFGVEWQEAASPCVRLIRERALHSLDDSLTPAGGLDLLTRDELER
jgi:hypothetical protein